LAWPKVTGKNEVGKKKEGLVSKRRPRGKKRRQKGEREENGLELFDAPSMNIAENSSRGEHEAR